ncbi:MAG: leucine-rich repeat domain-containing protein [Clostridia bacterium]|nr:leucine-rich repeat domain-containing protein [Clostridia bacterium]
MEELTTLQEGYYYLSKHQFDEAKLRFDAMVKEQCEDPHPYIGLLLAENGLVSEGQLADLPKGLEDYPLYMQALAHAKGTYRESLLEIRAKQNLRLLKKEEYYAQVLKGCSGAALDKVETNRLLGLTTELKDYKNTELYRKQLEEQLARLEEAERAAKKKRMRIILPLVGVAVVLVVLALFTFALPSRDGVRYVLTLDGYATLSAGDDLTTVTLAEEIYGIEVRHVGRKSFKYCTNLEEITLHEGITTIEKSAFSGCTALESVHNAESVDTVYGKAFKNCSALSGITLSEDAFIAQSAFRGCSAGIVVMAGEERVKVSTQSKN